MGNELMKLLHLSFEFSKVGLFSVGGGLATLPFLYHMGQKTGWFTAGDVSDMIAISQSTPGPMGINMATSVGYTIAGLWGALIAPVALVIPSVIIIIMISHALNRFKDSILVADIFYGLRPASIGLIVTAGISVAKGSLFTLEKYNISKEYLQEKSDKLLDTVLTDWKNYSGSSYSKDNMGRLTIEKDEFLR